MEQTSQVAIQLFPTESRTAIILHVQSVEPIGIIQYIQILKSYVPQLEKQVEDAQKSQIAKVSKKIIVP